MQAIHQKRPRIIISTCICLALLAVMGGSALFVHSSSARAANSSQPFRAHDIAAKPIVHFLSPQQSEKSFVNHVSALSEQNLDAKEVQFACQTNSSAQSTHCLGPYQVREAYGVTGLLQKGMTGAKRTITIIDAFGSPTIQQDLKAFDAAWGLPDTSLKVFTPYGTSGSDKGWRVETSLDVEWAHVMAPAASINLIAAKSAEDVDLYYALKYAVDQNLGDALSLSFGENETCMDPKLQAAEHQLFNQATQQGMSLIAATGDYGSAQYNCDGTALVKAISYPAADPLVTAVGGTTLDADDVSGQYFGETAWNESDVYNSATGGGYSTILARPTYQDDVIGNSAYRGVPDISLNASINGGVIVYQTDTTTKKMTVVIMGGTSVATPELSGLLVDGVQMSGHRLGTINPALYSIGISDSYTNLMNDVISGDNTLFGSNLSGYAAGTAWDPVTGWGSLKDAEPFLRALLSPPPPSARSLLIP